MDTEVEKYIEDMAVLKDFKKNFEGEERRPECTQTIKGFFNDPVNEGSFGGNVIFRSDIFYLDNGNPKQILNLKLKEKVFEKLLEYLNEKEEEIFTFIMDKLKEDFLEINEDTIEALEYKLNYLKATQKNYKK